MAVVYKKRYTNSKPEPELYPKIPPVMLPKIKTPTREVFCTLSKSAATLYRARGPQVILPFATAFGDEIQRPRVLQHQGGVFLLSVWGCGGLSWVLLAEMAKSRVILEMQWLAMHSLVWMGMLLGVMWWGLRVSLLVKAASK
jgi:hypothetical protein